MTSPFEVGRADALRGHTACPFGVPYDARRWALGYDKERAQTPGIRPRFADRPKAKGRDKAERLM
jgi:hypothetical protein